MRKLIITALLVCTAMTSSAQVADKVTSLIGSWNGKLKVGANALTLVFHLEQAEGHVTCSFDSPDQGAKGLGAYKEYLSEDSVALKMPDIGATFRAKFDNGKLTGTFSQMGMSFPLILERGAYKPDRPQTPATPYPYKTEEVTFSNAADNVTLAGTLTYPTGYSTAEKVPVVIMVTGSGLQNRDEEMFEHRPFLVIADHLARHGIASLRYDDRGFGASTSGNGKPADVTTPDYTRDAQAGIDFLKSLDRFGMTGVIGHSEGGNIAFMLGRGNKVDFVISMAGVGTKTDIALTAQYNRIVTQQGAGTTISVGQYRANVKSLDSGWMNWFIDYDPTADITATTCPVLAINGDKDCQVISSLNLTAIEKALPANNRTVIKEYPSLNHLFQHCKSGLPAEYGTIEETIAPEVLDDIAEWINNLTK